MIKGISETIENEVKEQKDGFSDMLLRTLVARLLRNMLPGERVVRGGDGVIRAG